MAPDSVHWTSVPSWSRRAARHLHLFPATGICGNSGSRPNPRRRVRTKQPVSHIRVSSCKSTGRAGSTMTSGSNWIRQDNRLKTARSPVRYPTTSPKSARELFLPDGGRTPTESKKSTSTICATGRRRPPSLHFPRGRGPGWVSTMPVSWKQLSDRPRKQGENISVFKRRTHARTTSQIGSRVLASAARRHAAPCRRSSLARLSGRWRGQ
ncbi:hypothetical protein LMG28138_05875 [Pararobbsia alpina]|uniref:Uncharacterized protein n=1 Tax=Pararobbsia alpina TaxID=621374 RepID=A0A6S7BPV2_9BURK|nr:hypothetical protein LMG28138_05875 [Pararobbsia alpina]